MSRGQHSSSSHLVAITSVITKYSAMAGINFSDFSLISDLFTSTLLRVVFEIESLEHVSLDFMADSVFKKKSVLFQTFSLNLTCIPCFNDIDQKQSFISLYIVSL